MFGKFLSSVPYELKLLLAQLSLVLLAITCRFMHKDNSKVHIYPKMREL